MCSLWIRNGKLEEHFVNMLRVKALDAATMTDTLCSCMDSNNLDYRKIGQSYDGTATFWGCNS